MEVVDVCRWKATRRHNDEVAWCIVMYFTRQRLGPCSAMPSKMRRWWRMKASSWNQKIWDLNHVSSCWVKLLPGKHQGHSVTTIWFIRIPLFIPFLHKGCGGSLSSPACKLYHAFRRLLCVCLIVRLLHHLCNPHRKETHPLSLSSFHFYAYQKYCYHCCSWPSPPSPPFGGLMLLYKNIPYEMCTSRYIIHSYVCYMFKAPKTR